MIKKILLGALAVVLLLFISVISFGPNYAKTYIEENSNELVGRQIKIEELDFNAFNGHLLITDFRLYENEDSAVFVQFDTFYTDLTLHKLIKGEFLTEALHIKGLDINVWTKAEEFNFDDLIPESDTTIADTSIESEDSFIKIFTINDIQILYSDVNYDDYNLGTNHNLKDLNIKVPGVSFGDERTQAGVEFGLAKGGTFGIDVDYNLPENSYKCNLVIEQLDLSPYLVYAQSSMNIANLEGWFSGEMHVVGDLDTPSTPVISGNMNLDDFLLVDNEGVEAVKMTSIFINAKELNLETNSYHFSSLQLVKPTLNVVQYADVDNLSSLMKEDADTSTVVLETTGPVKESMPLKYLLEEFRLENGAVYYSDKAIQNGPFNYAVTDIKFSADSLTEGRDVTFNMDAIMNEKGSLNGLIITDPGNPSKGGVFNLDLKKIPIEDFSVFSLNSTAYPINSGRLSFQTKNKVLNNHLNSHIILQLYKTEFGKKRKELKPEYNVPMKLGVVVLEDPKRLIKIDVPAEGDLEDPEFKYSKLIWKVVMNVLVKAATSPYNLLANSVGGDEDDIKFIRFELIQWELGPEQTSQLDMISDILIKKPGISVEATQVLDLAKEEKLIEYFLAKKGYFLQQKHSTDSIDVELDEVDRAKVLHMDETPEIIAFLELKTNSVPGELTFNELADLYVSPVLLKEKHTKVINARVRNLRAYISEKGLSDRFIILDQWTEDVILNKPRFEMKYQIKED